MCWIRVCITARMCARAYDASEVFRVGVKRSCWVGATALERMIHILCSDSGKAGDKWRHNLQLLLFHLCIDFASQILCILHTFFINVKATLGALGGWVRWATTTTKQENPSWVASDAIHYYIYRINQPVPRQHQYRISISFRVDKHSSLQVVITQSMWHASGNRIDWQLFDFCRFAARSSERHIFFSSLLIFIGFCWSFIACTGWTNEWMICVHRVHWFSKIHMFDAKCSALTLNRPLHNGAHNNGIRARIYDECIHITQGLYLDGQQQQSSMRRRHYGPRCDCKTTMWAKQSKK